MKIEDRMLSPLIVRHGNINSSFVPLYAVAASGKSLYEVKGRETCGQREILWVKEYSSKLCYSNPSFQLGTMSAVIHVIMRRTLILCQNPSL